VLLFDRFALGPTATSTLGGFGLGNIAVPQTASAPDEAGI